MKGLCNNDPKFDTVRGLWLGSSMVSDQVLEEKISELSKYLVADIFGNVQVAHWACEAYNARPLFNASLAPTTRKDMSTYSCRTLKV